LIFHIAVVVYFAHPWDAYGTRHYTADANTYSASKATILRWGKVCIVQIIITTTDNEHEVRT